MPSDGPFRLPNAPPATSMKVVPGCLSGRHLGGKGDRRPGGGRRTPGAPVAWCSTGVAWFVPFLRGLVRTTEVESLVVRHSQSDVFEGSLQNLGPSQRPQSLSTEPPVAVEAGPVHPFLHRPSSAEPLSVAEGPPPACPPVPGMELKR